MALLDEFANWVFDLDGTMYVGKEAVPGAPELVQAANEHAKSVLFVSNDPTHTSAQLARRLERLGIDADADRILHAGLAAALHLRERGVNSVLALGTDGLVETLTATGVDAERTETLRASNEHVDVDAVVVGLDPHAEIEDFNVLLRNWRPGMPVVACNADRSYPAKLGPNLGGGSFAAAVGYALDCEITYCGKPSEILFREAENMLPDGPTAMLGDSPEADVAGANAAGWTSVLLSRDSSKPGDPKPVHTVSDLHKLLES